MNKLSVIIPSRNEQFLQPTVKDLLEKAEGEIEVIAVLDGYWPDPPLEDNLGLRQVHFGQAKGMRNGITRGVAIAEGNYIMKIDAHCMVDKGFDLKLIAEHKDNWVQIPRRKRLDAENWCVRDTSKLDVDYEYPTNPRKDDMHGRIWTDRIIKRKDILIDDCPTFQGSCWFMKKDYFHELELMDSETYGMFYNEAQEISFKTWLSGGRVMVNKKTWYAHLHKGKKYGRGYPMGPNQRNISFSGMKEWAENNGWHKQTIDFSAFSDFFSDMPEWDQEDIDILKKKDKFHVKIKSYVKE